MRILILSLFLTITCSAQVMLVPVKTETCPPCRRFNADYINPMTGLRTWIKSKVIAGKAIDVGRNRAFAAKWKISRVPTFLLIDEKTEKELGRFTGYNGHADFKLKVTQKIKEIRSKQTPATLPQMSLPPYCPPATIPPIEIDLTPIQQRLDKLQSEVNDLKERGIANTQRIQSLERNLTEIQQIKRPVILKSGGKIIDREEYAPGEAIILDLKTVTAK